MPKVRTPVEIAAGKLISAIQKEWNEELGEPQAEQTENVMYLAHDLLQAGCAPAIHDLLGCKPIVQFLGEQWVQRHPSVRPAIVALEQAIQ